MRFVANLSNAQFCLSGVNNLAIKTIIANQSANWFHSHSMIFITQNLTQFVQKNIKHINICSKAKSTLPFWTFTILKNAEKNIQNERTSRNSLYTFTHDVFLVLFQVSRPEYMHNYSFYSLLRTRDFPRSAKRHASFEKVVTPLETCSRHEPWSILFFFIPRTSAG